VLGIFYFLGWMNLRVELGKMLWSLGWMDLRVELGKLVWYRFSVCLGTYFQDGA